MQTTKRLNASQLKIAAEILRDGGTVAFPTETVFGLGARFDDASAVQRVFEAKGRPSDNPLIVHLAGVEDLEQVCDEVPKIALELWKLWAPGPLTLVVPKNSKVPDIVTAGLDTVAVRIPSHPVARQLIRETGVPLVAPSANRSGRPSATTFQGVLEDLDGWIDAVVCEAGCGLGLESTVVDIHHVPPRLLRHGAITEDQLRTILPDLKRVQSGHEGHVNSPGLRHKHYQPSAKVIIEDHDQDLNGMRVARIGIDPCPVHADFILHRLCASTEEYAGALYEFFRESDRHHADAILCQSLPETGLGIALMDRIRRASQ
ncbi:MAG: L-threonylcarbamoyladenylate synthase [Pirellulales bacterium]